MIEMLGIKKSFNDHLVLDDLSFRIDGGEVYGLLGPNGSGKTTIISILCGFLKADSGTALLKGQMVSEKTKYRIGIAPQEISLYQNLTCKENLSFFASLYGLGGSQRTEAVRNVLKLCGLDKHADMRTSHFSGGFQRRLNIAVAIVHAPEILILDEPTVGLDIEARYDIWELIRSLKQSRVTVLLTTHYLDEAEKICSRIGILHQHRIVLEGSPESLCRQIPAASIAVLEAGKDDDVRHRAASLGLTCRYYGGKLAVWLPQPSSLKEVVEMFDGISLHSVSLQPVNLEHVYCEVTQQSPVDTFTSGK